MGRAAEETSREYDSVYWSEEGDNIIVALVLRLLPALVLPVCFDLT